jgi:alpha-L-rhamnosidase/F5/8 type C domain
MASRLMVALLAAAVSMPTASGADALEEGFQDPPAAARPRVWWHWMNGNVTTQGIDLDLAWLKRAGIGGVQNFDAALATPLVVPNRIAYMTPDWNAVFSHAVERADQLGLEFTIASSAGWSETGGPWVRPEQAMKKMVWSETSIQGGHPFNGRLTSPPSTTGPFQNVPAIAGGLFGHNGPDPLPVFYADSSVLAFKSSVSHSDIPVATSSDGSVNAANLMDGDFSTKASIDIVKNANPWIQYDYGKPRTFRAVSLATGAIPVFRSGVPNALLESSADGVSFHKVADVRMGDAPQQTTSFPAASGRYFRLVFVQTAPVAPELFAAAAPGADFSALSSLLPAASASRPHLDISELRFSGSAKVNQFELKGGFGVVPDYYALDAGSENTGGVDPRSVVNLTQYMDSSGRLHWNAPTGHWTVLRLGYSLIGVENHPATAEATGLEVDKLDGNAVKAYIDTYLDRYEKLLGPGLIGKRGVRAMLSDSTEVGPQNWTADILNEFRKHRGYDAIPWLPAMTGTIIGDEKKSSAFLYDFRRTLAELTAEQHYEVVAEAAHSRGLITYGEALEDGRPSLGDDLDMRRYTTIPMAAMWTFNHGAGARPSFEADIRGAAAVAHVYGKNLVAAESMTVALAPWNFAPVDLKSTIDLEFALGMNLPVIHTSVHQPLIDSKPGLSLSIFGQYFNRNDTWAEQARPWVDYMARNAFMLQQGRFFADVAYFYGEEAPLTGLYGRTRPTDIPSGYAFDFVNSRMLEHEFRVEDGALVASSGARYRLLFLGGSSQHMTLATLRRIRDLVREGAIVAGMRPASSPSLLDDPLEFGAVVEALWGAIGTSRSVGSGRVIAVTDPNSALSMLNLPPDFELSDASADAEVMFVHRKLADGDLYFVDNRRSRTERFTANFRSGGRAAEVWHAETGNHERVSFTSDGQRTAVPLALGPDESIFVVFRASTVRTTVHVPEETRVRVSSIDGPWNVTFEAARGAPLRTSFVRLNSWAENADPRIKYYSGAATYEREFKIPPPESAHRQRLELDLGDVRDLAEVRVNGKLVGTPWHPPYRVDITSAVRNGVNSLSVKAVNTWVNRLIGDQQPGADRETFTVIPTYLATAPLRPSGLMGPVELFRVERADQER